MSCFFTTLEREATHLAVSKTITCFHIFAISDSSSRGILRLGTWNYPCLLGRNGRTHLKREGDAKSPKGTFEVGMPIFRSDRVRRPKTRLGSRSLRPNEGWCDDVTSGRYNRPVRMPFAPGHEELWRKDVSYDIVAPTSHNQCPRIKGRGSAIFLHVIRESQTGTEGCIALSEKNLRNILGRCSGSLLLKI